MKQLFTLLFLVTITSLCMAQPVNDDCGGIIDLGTAPICPSPAVYTNVDATTSDIGNDNIPSCFFGNPERDVWFSFVATAAISDYEISVIGAGASSILNPQIALYRGDCGFDELALLDCASAQNGDSNVTLNISGLTDGITYFMRICDYKSSIDPNWGEFELCIQEFVQTEFTIDETGSDLCEGTLYDTGGPTGNYSGNENHIFTICPDTPPECLLFTLSQYNMENGNDNLIFYDGPSINSPVITSIIDGTNNSNGENIGGVCYPIAASSGCLTIQFISNTFSQFEGFAGTWECADECPQGNALSIETGSDEMAIADALQTPYFDITVTDINCDENGYGLFQQADDTGLGLNDGLLLTTGRAADVSNPASFHANTDLIQFGDQDLDVLDDMYGIIFSFGTRDVCIVEMDVFAKVNQIGFDYIFGSDEYQQNFDQFFDDDLMAVLIAGPGITGLPALNGQQNLAWVPGFTNQSLIQIQQVNAATNWQYFRNNLENPFIAYNGLTSGFLGNTKTLYAGTNITPCETYKVKIAIGDTDPNDDSGLFIQSSNIGYPSVNIDFNTGIDYLVEGCTNLDNTVVVSLPSALSDDFIANVTIGGTASIGSDYFLNIPSSITIPAGETKVSFPLSVQNDGASEGTETIELTLTGDYGCGSVMFSSLVVEIKDQLEVNILPDQDTIFVCDGVFTAELEAIGAASYNWSPPNLFDDPNSPNPTVTINTSQSITVTGTLGNCTAEDEVFLQIISPSVDVQPDGPLLICEGEIVQLNAANNVSDEGLEWSPTVGLADPQSSVTDAQPDFSITYTATVTATGGCSASDEITISVEPFDFPSWVSVDTTICQNSSIQLADVVSNSTTIFEWTPDLYLDNADISNAVATPDETTTYTLNATSENGLCTETESVAITVLPADVDISPDTIDLCIGDSAMIEAITSTGGVGVTWSPMDSLTLLDAEHGTVKPSISTWYYVTLEIGICTVVDSVFVRVDSLPQMTAIEAIPAKESYCEGEIISLVSPNYEKAFYPDIQFQWTPINGVVSDDTLFNLAINAVETITYFREINNNACSTLDSIEIIVVPVANIEITPQNPSVCPGESVQLNVTADQPMDEWEWSPSDGLSCTDCTDPVATPPSTITYQVKGESLDCPSFAQVTVEVLGTPNYAFPSATNICMGESIVLNTVEDPNATYQWLNPDGSQLSDEAQPVVSPTQTTTYTLIIGLGTCPPITDEVTVTIQEDFTVTVGDDLTICADEEVQLLVNSSTSNVNVVWEDGNGDPVPNGIVPANTLVSGNTYVFSVEVSDEPFACFTHTESVIVEVLPDFNLTVSGDQNTIGGEPVTLEASADLAGVTFIWKDSNGSVVGEGNSITVSPCETETYTVEATHPNGCSLSDAFVTVNVDASFTLMVSPDQTINSGESVTLEASADLDGVTFIWENSDGEMIVSENLTVSPCDTSEYFVEALHPNDCLTLTDTVTVNVLSSFTIDSLMILQMDTVPELYEGEEINAWVVTIPDPLSGVTYEWFIDSVLVATTNSPESGDVNLPELPDGVLIDSLILEVIATNADGCMQTDTVKIGLLDNPVEIPNVFTPNGDNTNDLFTAVSIVPVDILGIRIWNRWGKKVYDNEDGSGAWDGMLNDKAAASDVYIYQIQYSIAGGENIYTERGDVTLLR